MTITADQLQELSEEQFISGFTKLPLATLELIKLSAEKAIVKVNSIQDILELMKESGITQQDLGAPELVAVKPVKAVKEKPRNSEKKKRRDVTTLLQKFEIGQKAVNMHELGQTAANIAKQLDISHTAYHYNSSLFKSLSKIQNKYRLGVNDVQKLNGIAIDICVQLFKSVASEIPRTLTANKDLKVFSYKEYRAVIRGDKLHLMHHSKYDKFIGQ